MVPAGEARSRLRSGSRYSRCSDDVSKADSTLSSSGSDSSATSGFSSDGSDGPTTSGYASAPSSRRCCGVIGCGSGSTRVLCGLRLARRPLEARASHPIPRASSRGRCGGGSRPVEAPVTSRSPPRSSAPPMIAAPVVPMSAARVPPMAIPIQPPESLPRSVMRPRKLTPTPSRNGRTSRSSLRASNNPPRATSASGSTYAALPTTLVRASASQEPTAPPSSPR